MRHISDDDLAKLLERQQVDRTVLIEAARRIRACDVQALLDKHDIIETIASCGLFTAGQTSAVEQLILNAKSPRRSSARMSSLAGRILNGEPYTSSDVHSLAASVLSQDQTPEQS